MANRERFSVLRALAAAFLSVGLITPAVYSLPRPQDAAARPLAESVSGKSGKKHGLFFRSERFGIAFQYPAGYKLSATSPFSPPGSQSDSLPVAATYELIPPSRPGGTEGRPYSYQYYVFFVRLGFAGAANALGISRNSKGKWIYKDAGIPSQAVQISRNGWRGLRMTYGFRLYNAPNAEERAQGLELGNGYLGMSEGEKDLIGAGENLSMVLEFDPDIQTDAVRDRILNSLRFN